MFLNSIFFYFFAAVAIASAVLAVTRRNVIRSAIFFLAALVATGGIFLGLQAAVLFGVQLMVCAGGIASLFLFALLLAKRDRPVAAGRLNRQMILGVVFALVLAAQIFAAMWAGGKSLHLPLAGALPAKNTEAVGDALFQHYVLPFEMISLLLLVALVGGITTMNGSIE